MTYERPWIFSVNGTILIAFYYIDGFETCLIRLFTLHYHHHQRSQSTSIWLYLVFCKNIYTCLHCNINLCDKERKKENEKNLICWSCLFYSAPNQLFRFPREEKKHAYLKKSHLIRYYVFYVSNWQRAIKAFTSRQQ